MTFGNIPLLFDNINIRVVFVKNYVIIVTVKCLYQ